MSHVYAALLGSIDRQSRTENRTIRRRKPPLTDDPADDPVGRYEAYTRHLLAAAIAAEDWLSIHHAPECRTTLWRGTCSCGTGELADALSAAIDGDEER